MTLNTIWLLWEWHIKKKNTETANVGKSVEKKEPFYPASGKIVWPCFYEKQYGSFSKYFIDLP